MCYDDWTKDFSDSYCRSLGFATSETVQSVPLIQNVSLLRLKTDADAQKPFVSNLEETQNCATKQIVEVICQQFSCGSHEAERPTARLVGGTRAEEGQWSSVTLLKEQKQGAACTASVIGPMHAIASYSCIHR